MVEGVFQQPPSTTFLHRLWAGSNSRDVCNDLDKQLLKNQPSECGYALPLLGGGNPAWARAGRLVPDHRHE